MTRIESSTRSAAGCRRLVLGLALASGTLMCSVPVAAAETSLEQWLLRRLNDPTERERAHEREGNVYIYDGLTDREVDLALNKHFERIEYMMFVGTRKTDSSNTPDDRAETESPGCGSDELASPGD
jgi:hypothetical protein